MKQFLLVRHAKSDWSDDSLTDFERPLAERGEHDAPLMAAYIKERGLRPTFVLASPARRAYTTARTFADTLGIPENDLATEEELYEASAQRVLSAVLGLPETTDFAAVFGHNPAFTYLVSDFTPEYVSNVPTCGVAHLVSEATQWNRVSTANTVLRKLYTPKAVLDAYA